MADIPHSSFIPKEATGLTPGKIRKRRTFSVFTFVATALLVGSIALAGGTYILRGAAKGSLDDAQLELASQKDLFNESDVEEIREFDRRIQAGKLLLTHHLSPSKIFTALEGSTKQRIQFTSFEFVHNPSVQALLTLQGQTAEFKTLALQELGFEQDPVLKTVPFSELGTKNNEVEGEGGGERQVTFALSGELDLTTISYDGVNRPTPTTFIENSGTLSLQEVPGAVLGDSITNTDI